MKLIIGILGYFFFSYEREFEVTENCFYYYIKMSIALNKAIPDIYSYSGFGGKKCYSASPTVRLLPLSL